VVVENVAAGDEGSVQLGTSRILIQRHICCLGEGLRTAVVTDIVRHRRIIEAVLAKDGVEM
jgi:hypothetical protein